MPNILILGAGRVGSAIARDLAQYFHVLAVDREGSQLDTLRKINSAIKILKTDLVREDFKQLLKPADLVISAVPGYLGFQTLKKIIEAGKNVVDISFFPEDPFALDDLARKYGTKAVVDCGVAPGMGNIILGRYNRIIKIDSYECLVGGLPEKREWPWQYKAVFSPIDVIEEYVRPARIVSGGKTIIREALSDPEYIEFDEIGTLESFNTDGLRTLIRTMTIPDMIEKTLRYPGSIEYLQVLRAGGFFSSEPVEIDGIKIRPIDLTSKLLFPQWKLNVGEKDLTVMKITIRGRDNEGISRTIVYRLLDHYDEINKTLSMARTTGYTACAVAHLMINGQVKQTGILPPEKIGEDAKNFSFILDYLKERNVAYQKSVY
ncbi:MAG: saccharopine dehydrogenase NADP-binding domain-containing protein [Cyclobacteriaceae bacterium]|nr:saccharopine dehydrogenase NADP-binding domain-containing protein [Cyclobacteriaceae bacterium]